MTYPTMRGETPCGTPALRAPRRRAECSGDYYRLLADRPNPSLPCGIGGFPPRPCVRRAPAAGCPSPRNDPPHSRHYLTLPRAADCRVMAAKKDWGPDTLRRCVGNLSLFRLGPNPPFFAAAGVNRPLVAAAIGYPPPMSSGFLQGRRPALRA